MFLHVLNKNEKESFMDVANIAMTIDGFASEEEKLVLETFSYECELPGYIPSKKGLDELLEELTKINVIKKRVILIELISVWSADGVWEKSEVEMLRKIRMEFDFSDKEVEKLKKWSLKMKNTIFEGYSLIKGEI